VKTSILSGLALEPFATIVVIRDLPQVYSPAIHETDTLCHRDTVMKPHRNAAVSTHHEASITLASSPRR